MTHDNNAPNTWPVTWNLLESIWFHTELSPAARVDFGIDSQAHFEALREAVRSDQITNQQLDAALGNGPKLTALVNGIKGCNPKGIVFVTAWDVLHGRDVREENIEPPEQLKPQQRHKQRRRNMEQER